MHTCRIDESQIDCMTIQAVVSSRATAKEDSSPPRFIPDAPNKWKGRAEQLRPQGSCKVVKKG